MALFPSHDARLAADAARRQAGYRGHRLDRFQREAGRPTAVCSCGVYVFVDREGMGYRWGYGRLSRARRLGCPRMNPAFSATQCDWTLETGLPCGQPARLILDVDDVAHGACEQHLADHTLWLIDNMSEVGTIVARRVP